MKWRNDSARANSGSHGIIWRQAFFLFIYYYEIGQDDVYIHTHFGCWHKQTKKGENKDYTSFWSWQETIVRRAL